MEVQRELLESLNDEDLLQIPDDYRRIFEPEDHIIQSQITIQIEGVEDDEGAEYDAVLQELLSEAEANKGSPGKSENREDEENSELYNDVNYLISESDKEMEEELKPTPVSPKTRGRRRNRIKSKGKFVCEECGNHFKGERAFTLHCNRHRGVKNYACE